jgi:hypothetical protein
MQSTNNQVPRGGESDAMMQPSCGGANSKEREKVNVKFIDCPLDKKTRQY